MIDLYYAWGLQEIQMLNVFLFQIQWNDVFVCNIFLATDQNSTQAKRE